MKLHSASLALTAVAAFYSTASVTAFVPVSQSTSVAAAKLHSSTLANTAEDLVASTSAASGDENNESSNSHSNDHSISSVPLIMTELTAESVGKLKWRDLQRELQVRELDTSGTTAILRDRLRDSADIAPTKPDINGDLTAPDECPTDLLDIDFVDASDPFTELLNDVMTEANRGYWKRATRRLKKLQKNFGETYCIPNDAYVATLTAVAQDRLHGARASESARKIMEQMVDLGYTINTQQLNFCVQSCLGYGPGATHEGHGGIDTALAMMAAIGKQEAIEGKSLVTVDTYARIIEALAREGGASVNDALNLLRSVIVDKRETPPLSAFAAVAFAESKADTDDTPFEPDEDVSIGPEMVFNVIAYVKAAGYELDSIASTEDGRRILTAGVIAADKMKNVRLGLRLLKAASEAPAGEKDTGDVMIFKESNAARRAATSLHRQAINTAVEDSQWQLAVKLLSMMMERTLKPSTQVWRNVVTCCAKEKKSRKATAVLLDWVKLYEQKKAEKPPQSVFNTCINACEICGEQELTIPVLEAMKKTHETDGNIITFNIALKRLARLGNHWAPEGIIIGMLQNGIEPTVVSYTTAIAACAAASPKQPQLANEWMERMRSRNVNPNVITYNTALAACLDGNFTSTSLASTIATQMLADVDKQLVSKDTKTDEYTSVIPDYSTKAIARQLMKQLKTNWEAEDVDKQVAKTTLRVPLLALVEFSKSKASKEAQKQEEEKAAEKEEDELVATDQTEVELEYSEASKAHRTAEV